MRVSVTTPWRIAMRRAAAVAVGAATLVTSSSTADASSSSSFASERARVVEKPRDARELVRVQILFRHGDRTPITGLCPRHEDVEAWKKLLLAPRERDALRARARVPAEWEARGLYDRGESWEGELTRRGSTQMRALGREIIADWLVGELKFLSSNFEEARARGEVKVRSTAVARCVASAQSVLAGGWPASSEEREIGNDGALVVEVRAKERETMFPKPGSTCARLNEVFARSWAPDAREDAEAFRNENLAALRDGIAEARGKAVGLVMVWDPLQCRVNHLSEGMTLPLGVTVEEVARLLTLMERRHFATFASPEASPLIGSQLLREICEEMVAPGDVKLSLYSGHDSTLMSIFAALGALGTLVVEWPRTASSLIFETWRMTDGTLGVRAVYNGEPLALTPTSRASDGITRYEDFESFVRRRVPADFAAACRAPAGKARSASKL